MKLALRQAVVAASVCCALALVAAVVWQLLGEGSSFSQRLGICLAVVGALIGFSGGSMLNRLESADERAFLGWGPELRNDEDSVGLTSIGVFLFVGLPMMAIGAALLLASTQS